MNKELLKKENIVLNADPKDKWEAIKISGSILVEQGYVTPSYIDDMIEREKGFGVYIGNHVAIPHGLVESADKIIKSGISIVQTPKGVSFGEEKAYVFIGIAGKGMEHIDILQKVAMVCMDVENVEKIRDAKSKEEIMHILMDEGGYHGRNY